MRWRNGNIICPVCSRPKDDHTLESLVSCMFDMFMTKEKEGSE